VGATDAPPLRLFPPFTRTAIVLSITVEEINVIPNFASAASVAALAPPPRLGRIVAVALQKGGVSKTTTVVNLAHALAEMGRRVLVVDTDPQANATTWLGGMINHDGNASWEKGTLACLLHNRAAQDEIVRVADGRIDLLPAHMALVRAEVQLVQAISREHKLRRALRPTAAYYDVVLIDTPPNLGLLTLNALTAADEVLVPVEASPLALQGVVFLSEAVDMVRAETNPALVISGFIATRVDRRNKLSAEVVASLRQTFGDATYRTEVRESVRLREAPSHIQPITSYDPKGHGAEDYRALAAEFLERLERGDRDVAAR
jgi:chromosome partitioning protein